MNRTFHAPPSPAMAVALLALFVAFGGTGYAASQLGHRSTAVVAKKKKKKPPKHSDESQDIALIANQASRLRGPQGAQGNPGPRGNPGANGTNGTNGTNAVVGRTRLHYTDVAQDSTPVATYTFLHGQGTFTKHSAASTIRLTWNSNVRVIGTAAFCEFELRIDGAKDTGSTSTAVDSNSGGSAVVYAPAQAVSVTDDFTGLANGVHTVSIWDRGVGATSCIDNDGAFGHDVFVDELG